MESNEFLGLDTDLSEKTLQQYSHLDKEIEESDNMFEIGPVDEDEFPIPIYSVRIVNIVASVDYGCDLDLLKIATGVRNAEYNPKRFPAVTIRIQEPKATALAFSNGKVNIVGSQDEAAAKLAYRKFGRIFKQLGFNVKSNSFKISNIVAVLNCRFPIHLESLATAHKDFVSYNPEIFAGLIYTIEKLNATLLIFVTGSIVVTGTKTIKDIYEAVKFIYPILVQYARGVQPLPIQTPEPSTNNENENQETTTQAPSASQSSEPILPIEEPSNSKQDSN